MAFLLNRLPIREIKTWTNVVFLIGWMFILPIMKILELFFYFIYGYSCSTNKKLLLDAVVCTTMWINWQFRNDRLFAANKIRKSEIMDSVKEFSFYGFVTGIVNVLKIGFVGCITLLTLCIFFYLFLFDFFSLVSI